MLLYFCFSHWSFPMLPSGSNHNHLPRPPVVAVGDGQARVLLRRETAADLLALDEG